MKILVTGAAGFIGYHLSLSLLSSNHKVFGLDNLNTYYDKELKNLRLKNLKNSTNSKNFLFLNQDIVDQQKLNELFNKNNFDIVVHLAAQAGVRYSIDSPLSYVDSNLVGFVNILEAVRSNKIKHFVFASSSSVYGMNKKQPFSINDKADCPVSLYAATKKSNELMAYSYSHLYKIPTTGLRFFTVYGEYGRPDMAYFKFTKSILNGNPIDVYNNGEMYRDFTYIDDIVNGIELVINKPPGDDKIKAPYRLFNIGNNKPVSLNEFIKIIEEACQKKAIKNMLPMQPGDVYKTFADIDDIKKEIGFQPNTKLSDGIKKFVIWFKETYT